MPCRSDYMAPTPGEHRQTNKVNADLKALADKLTYSCDILREHILGETDVNVLPHINLGYARDRDDLIKQAGELYVKADTGLIHHVNTLTDNYQWLNEQVVAKPDSVRSKSVTDRVRDEQIKHREADLSRLMRVFADKGDRVRLRKVLDADATKPLKPQLGFDADDF